MKIIEFDYRQERLRTGKVVLRPVAKVYLFRSGSEWIIERVPFLLGRENVFEYFEITFQQRIRKVVFVWHGEKVPQI